MCLGAASFLWTISRIKKGWGHEIFQPGTSTEEIIRYIRDTVKS